MYPRHLIQEGITKSQKRCLSFIKNISMSFQQYKRLLSTSHFMISPLTLPLSRLTLCNCHLLAGFSIFKK